MKSGYKNKTSSLNMCKSRKRSLLIRKKKRRRKWSTKKMDTIRRLRSSSNLKLMRSTTHAKKIEEY